MFTLKTDKEESAKFPAPLKRAVANTFLAEFKTVSLNTRHRGTQNASF